ncbi:MAG TPA: TonB-dependent receptor, partial [Sphingomicrobium sp.]|nr:TonB-dependent receptor [Sphingomicrobium sp.]
TGTFTLSRFNVDFGGRREKDTRDTYRLVGGVQGDFNDDWHYEVALNYGHFKQRGKHLNDLQLFDIEGNFAAYLLAYDAARDASGNIVCRVNADASTTNDVPGCVPINVFGHGAPSQEALDFVNATSRLNQKATQFNAVAYVNGDLSQLFELPGGAPRFVVGAEHRSEKAHLKADPLSASGATFFNAFQEFDPPTMKVNELFGELELPILRDRPFFNELTFTAAGRWSDYKGAGQADSTFAYNLNGTWGPVRDLRLRGNYSKAVRVPTLSDLFFPETQNFASISDPCDANRIGPVGSTREVNCRALGVPVGFVSTFTNSQTAEIISAGNPLLTEETGKSLTLGTVFTPRWVPGLSLSVDYYRIRVANLISVLTANQIVSTCVDLPSIDNQYCNLIFPRQTVDDPTTTQNDVGALQNPALISRGLNFAKQEADGVDFELTYRKNFANGHRLNFRGIATRVLKRNNYVSPTQPDFRDVQLNELGDPKWAANATVVYGIGPLDVRYTVNYIGRMTIGAYENYFGVQDRPPLNADLTRERWYPEVMYHALRANMKIRQGGRERINVYAGVDNVFDTKPPFGLLGTGGGDPYDTVGRYFYAGATVDF